MFLNDLIFHCIFFDKYIKNPNDYLITSVLINKNEFEQKISTKKFINILFIYEPIKHFSKPGDNHEFAYKGLIENKFNIIIGSINHNPKEGRYKFPLYLFSKGFDITNYKQFAQTNNTVFNQNITSIKNKSFCTLINSWDPANTRTCIYRKLLTINSNIVCPGKLFNNCSNIELDRIGKVKYIKNFIFNICAENYDFNNVDGYITEKLMDCCLAGAIPIYAGWFDEYDEKIFNRNRIIFYNSQDNNSINNAFIKVKELIENDDKLIQFYQQPVFCETANDTIKLLLNCFLNKVNNKTE